MTKSCLDSRPSSWYPGVIVGDALHWIAHSSYPYLCSKMVVVFKIETQELYSLPHPPVARGGNNGGNLISATTTCDFDTHESYMQLTAKDGQLCFCHSIVEERAVDLWILEDYDNWGLSWVKKFKVNLVSIHNIFRSTTRSGMGHYLRGLRIGSPQNGSNEILVTFINCHWKGLYGYHLETHRSRQLETPGLKVT
ncbi:hypothetical protein Leryth_012300 [Lithospermum erythrorhizon]|nr:hypothetical protein Leryth_012300 [Lithospermum erythrorhizon]